MFHAKRRWCVGPIDTPEALAKKLTQQTWTLCTGFSLGDYLFLNDATCEDGAGEYGVVQGGFAGPHRQIESVTFSWCNESRALELIKECLNCAWDKSDFGHAVELTGRLDPVGNHHCRLCA